MIKMLKQNIKYKSHYNTYDISNIELGSSLPFNLFIKKDDDFVIIVEAGTSITEKIYTILEKKDNIYVSKRDQNRETLSAETLEQYIKYNKDNTKQCLDFLYQVNNKLFNDFLNNNDDILDLESVYNLVKSVIFLIKNNSNYLKTTIPDFINDDSLANHSLHVLIYVVNLGNVLNYRDKELNQLGIAALLHDIGTKRIDDSITSKDDSLSMQELKAIQRHTQYSVEIIKHNRIHDPYIIDAVLHHHENQDGTGYPANLQTKKISDFASIVSISDVFNALTSKRPYREKLSSLDAITLMIRDSKMCNKFNKKSLEAFLKSLM